MSALTEALAIARERLRADSDAYADEDIIDRLVAAIEAEGLGNGGASGDLLVTANLAAGHARAAAEVGETRDEAAEVSRTWAEAARIALEGWRNAPPPAPPEGAELDDSERAAVDRMVRGYRDRIVAHERFLVEMGQTFTAGGTPTSQRIAARIDRHLGEHGTTPRPAQAEGGGDAQS